jgi:plastocyanin
LLLPLGAIVVIGIVLFGFSRVLLSVTPTAATIVAVVVAAAIMAIAAVAAGRKRMTNGVLFSAAGAVIGVSMLAGGVALLAVGSPEAEGGGEGRHRAVTLAAPPNAAVDGFAQTKLSLPAGVPVGLEFDNQDPGVQHNVVIFDGEDAEAPVLVEGELITGPGTVTYPVPPLQPGSYFFHCEVHPTAMTGTIRAAEGGGGGGGGGGAPVTVVAQNLAFDTDEIHLPPGAPSTITFENRDAGTPHNIAIYGDQSLGEVLFQGELVTGPATADYQVPPLDPGTYYFHCDVHPSMQGSVVVGPGDAGDG